MKEIKLSQQGKNKSLGLVAWVDDEDYEWLNQWKWYVKVKKDTHYAARTDNKNKRRIYMHRLILGLKDKKEIVDHIDHNGFNNQRSNLRIANDSQSQANRCSKSGSSSKYLGVSWDIRQKKWVAKICKNKILKNLGSFNNEADAAIAYNRSASVLHGEFANLNIV